MDSFYKIIAGIISILFGIVWIVLTKKNLQNKPSGLAEDWRGFIAGGSLIFLGLVLLLKTIIES